CSCFGKSNPSKISAITLDEYEVNGAMMKYFYTKTYVNYFTDTYPQYAPYLGVSSLSEYMRSVYDFFPSLPHDEQSYTIDDQSGDKYETWQDFFTAQTVENVKDMLLYRKESDVLGVSLDDADEDSIDKAVNDIIDTLTESFDEKSSKKAIEMAFGEGVAEEDIRDAIELETLATKTAKAISEDILGSITLDQIDSEYSENMQKYSVVDYFSYKFSFTLDELTEQMFGKNTRYSELSSFQKVSFQNYYTKKLTEVQNTMNSLLKAKDLKEFQEYVISYVANSTFDNEYSLAVENLNVQISESTVKENMVNAVLTEISEGRKSPKNDAQNGSIYGIQVNSSNYLNAAFEVKKSIFEAVLAAKNNGFSERVKYIAPDEETGETDEFSEWAFTHGRKANETKSVIYSKDGEEFSAEVFFLTNSPYKNDRNYTDYAYLFFYEENDAKNLINQLRVNVSQDEFLKYYADKKGMSSTNAADSTMDKFISESDIENLKLYFDPSDSNMVIVQKEESFWDKINIFKKFQKDETEVIYSFDDLIQGGSSIKVISPDGSSKGSIIIQDGIKSPYYSYPITEYSISELISSDYKSAELDEWLSTAAVNSVSETPFKVEDGYLIAMCIKNG
ncbi:MAG: hypothetical protein J6U68_01630, partial [Clostridia bacterium]|nr:hypothetical protein [Clostridia bacterium]